jgi:hypothetical protein
MRLEISARENVSKKALQGRVICPGQSFLSRRYLRSPRISQYSSTVVFGWVLILH